MEGRLLELERQVERLSKTVAELQQTVQSLSPGAALVGTPTPEPVSVEPLAPPSTTFEGTVPLVGRTVLAIGGAFLVRAITDRDLVPHDVGVGLGVTFAAVWVLMAWVSASKGRALSATFHALTAALTGYPLLVETASRLALVPVPLAAVMLALFTVALLFTAERHALRAVAWLSLLAGLGATTTLAALAEAPTALSLTLLTLFGAALTLDFTQRWSGLRWPVALVLDFMVLRRVMSVVAHPEWSDQLSLAVTLAELVVLVTVAAAGLRAWRCRAAGAFELVQGAAALAIAVAVAVRAGEAMPWLGPVTGVSALVIALGAALLALRASSHLAFEAKQAGCEAQVFDVWLGGGLAVALVLSGGLLLSRGPAVTVLWLGLAVVTTLLGRRSHPVMLWLFSAVFLLASAVSGGLVAAMAMTMAGPAEPWPMSFEPPLVVLLAGLCFWLSTRAHRDLVLARVAAAVTLALTALGAVALVVWLIHLSVTELSSVVLARTLVLCLGVVALALVRRAGLREGAWIAWPLLGLCGIKLLVQDLPAAHAATLFISFAAVGATIIVLPRVIRPRNV